MKKDNWDWAGTDVQVITIDGLQGEATSKEIAATFEGIALGLRDKHIPILHALMHTGKGGVFIQIVIPNSGTNIAENFLADEGFECLIHEATLMDPLTKQ